MGDLLLERYQLNWQNTLLWWCFQRRLARGSVTPWERSTSQCGSDATVGCKQEWSSKWKKRKLQTHSTLLSAASAFCCFPCLIGDTPKSNCYSETFSFSDSRSGFQSSPTCSQLSSNYTVSCHVRESNTSPHSSIHHSFFFFSSPLSFPTLPFLPSSPFAFLFIFLHCFGELSIAAKPQNSIMK